MGVVGGSSGRAEPYLGGMPWGMLRLTLVVFAGRQLYVLTHPNHKLHVPFEICLRDSEWDRMPREGPVVQKRHL